MSTKRLPIPGFDGKYLIDDRGRVFSAWNSRGNPLPRPRQRKLQHASGQAAVQLRKNSTPLHYRVSALIALTFHGKVIRYGLGRTPIDLDTHYVIAKNGCWIWKGGKDKHGYGYMSGHRRAHRVYYERANGRIPLGLCVLHKCDNPPCVNPNHLFIGTQGDNSTDKISKGRQVRGERVHTAKLTAKSVRKIRLATGKIADIGARFGVTDVSVSYIKSRKTWKHVT